MLRHMRTIHKFPLPVEPFVIPGGIRVVHVGPDPSDPDRDLPTVWVERDLDRMDEKLGLMFVGTGHDIPEGVTHVGSGQFGRFIWHVYQAQNVI